MMNEQIKNIMNQAGTDISGKWLSVDNAEKFAELVIERTHELIVVLGHDRLGDVMQHFGLK